MQLTETSKTGWGQVSVLLKFPFNKDILAGAITVCLLHLVIFSYMILFKASVILFVAVIAMETYFSVICCHSEKDVLLVKLITTSTVLKD